MVFFVFCFVCTFFLRLVRLSSSAPDARGIMGMLSRAGDKRYTGGLGLAAAAKYLGRVGVQGKKTAVRCLP